MLGDRVRVLAPVAATAIVSSALSVMINIATGPETTWWVWACVVGLTAATCLLAIQRQKTTTSRSAPNSLKDTTDRITQSVSHTTAQRIYQIGSVNGNIKIAYPVWTVGAVFLIGVLIITAAMMTRIPANPKPLPPPPSGTDDIAMLDIWPSSKANTSVDIPEGKWVMTDFPVRLPYIRSIQVAAAPAGWGGDSHGKKVLLRILDAHGKEIDSGEGPIVDYRATYTFSHPVYVHPYLGQHLYLQMMNIAEEKVRAFFSQDDRDPSITSYVPCAESNPVLCPNPLARDLSARVVGRTGTW